MLESFKATVGIALIIFAVFFMYHYLIKELPPIKEKTILEQIKKSKNPILVCSEYVLKHYEIDEKHSLVIWKDKDRAFDLYTCKVIEGK